VAFRGIFINDEDWGLQPWSNQTYEPSPIKGQIGPSTHRRIFELLLRLRANTYWPPMHEVSRPFYFTKGNQEMADAFGIYIGTSHCEPMMRNAAGEWHVEGTGAYDYVHNQQAVYQFWEQRVKEVAGRDNIYTLGIRGVHDGKMQGAESIAEQKAALTQIIADQRGLLRKYVQPNLHQVPQVFIPYKEVLDVYHDGLQVPDDVTLVWCDDNYGYIRHFPDPTEAKRSGGNGLYYHISYWGRPHDYLWLGTAHPALIYQQMNLAYDKDIQKIWILNVGDIKPSEYQIELFMDMAWNIQEVRREGPSKHLDHWMNREFGAAHATELASIMREHYRLAYIRKPEFMGNTRVEEQDPSYQLVKDLPWSEKDIRERLQAYDGLLEKTEELADQLDPGKQDSYFELVRYPVQAASYMNRKLLIAQLARHQLAPWSQSDAAFDSIVSLTHRYNTLKGGKWNRMMDYQPRKLPVFERIKHQELNTALPTFHQALYRFNGSEFNQHQGKVDSTGGLGYEGRAVALQKGGRISFQLPSLNRDSIWIALKLVPNHPVAGDLLRVGISLDDFPMQTCSYQTQGRSEEWKQHVLANQAIRWIRFPISHRTSHTLTLTALDEGVLVDQLFMYDRKPF